MAALMQDVAERAGVSITTVSHVFNATRTVADQTRDRVLKAARDLNFHPNASARLLARGASDSFGLLISDIENPFFPELIKSFERACLKAGMEVLLCTTNYDAEQEARSVRRMLQNKVRGVAVMTSQLGSERIGEIGGAGTPIVLLDGGPAGQGRSNIRVDYSHGVAAALRHLHSLGHRRFGFISGPQGRTSATRYRQAFMDGIAALKLPEPQVLEGDNTPQAGEQALRTWLDRGALPEAVLCGNDLCGFGAMRAAFNAGLRVPDDVAIVGADDIGFARLSHPPLSTIRIPRDCLGEMAFKALHRMMRSKRCTGRELVVETEFVLRESAAERRSMHVG